MNTITQVPRRAAVFGASGGIGRALVAELGGQGWEVAAGSRRAAAVPGATASFAFDLLDEPSIASAAMGMAARPPELVFVATGALVLEGGVQPERIYRELDPEAMVRAFRVNAVGPALIAKYVLPLLPRDRRAVFAALGARVGSIGDNRLGGWHSYRAGKAALAMVIRNLAIEFARTHPHAIVAGLHPGTVDTPLSNPFQARLPPGQLITPYESARRLIAVAQVLQPRDSGSVFDHNGAIVPP